MILYFILTATLASVATFYAPILVACIKRFKTRKQRKLNELIRAEVERQLKDIIND
jgi:hypothetical protein